MSAPYYKLPTTPNLKRVYILLDYLEKRYKCKITPRDKFARTLVKKAGDDRYPTKETVDGIIQEWEFWKEYLEPGSFEEFVKADLIDLFAIKCTATSYCRTNDRMYVGLKAKVKDPAKLPFQTATVVQLNGTFLINGEVVRRKENVNCVKKRK